RARKPFGILVLMRGKLRRRAKGFEVVTLRIERGELYRTACCFHSRGALALERVDRAEIQPPESMARIRIHGLVAALASGFQVLQQVAADEPFGGQREGVGRIAVESGVRGAQGLGRLALAVLGPAARNPEDVPVTEPRARRRDTRMPVDQFVKDLSRLEKLVLAGAVHQLDAAK